MTHRDRVGDPPGRMEAAGDMIRKCYNICYGSDTRCRRDFDISWSATWKVDLGTLGLKHGRSALA